MEAQITGINAINDRIAIDSVGLDVDDDRQRNPQFRIKMVKKSIKKTGTKKVGKRKTPTIRKKASAKRKVCPPLRKKGGRHSHKEHCIIKRQGHKEHYDERKVYKSVYAACFVVSNDKDYCTDLSLRIAAKVTKWIHRNHEVTNEQVTMFVAKLLKQEDPDIAFLYEHHMDIS